MSRFALVALVVLVAGCMFDESGLEAQPPPGGPADDGTGGAVEPPPGIWRSCAALAEVHPETPSGVYPLVLADGTELLAHCEMDAAGGGWTLALKADGRRSTFAYDSSIWESPDPHNAQAAALDDGQEAKLASFAHLPVNEVLVMFLGTQAQERHVTILPAAAPSLMALVSGPPRVVDGSGREAWLASVPDGELQGGCTLEGFNLGNGWNRVRIGLVANNETDECDTHDSRIGVGGGGCAECTHCGGGPGMAAPSVGNNFKGCAARPVTAAVFVR